MASIRQGQIWWARLPGRAGRRPVLILTRTAAIPHLSNITVAPLSRTIRDIDSEVVLTPEQGLPTMCAITLDNVLTIPQTELEHHITTAASETMAAVFEAVRFAFAMPPA
jgi:mRNA interferase MazF